MNELQIFNNEEFGEIRTVIKDNEPMFCLPDVCKALEISHVTDVKNRLKQDGVGTAEVIDSMRRKQNATFINESNLYRVIFQSRKESAERFTDWVTAEVLPSIRKNGSYIAGHENVKNETKYVGVSLKEQVESLEVVAEMLHMNDASKIGMLENFYKSYNIPTAFLPKYEFNDNRSMKSATELLKLNNCKLSARKFNELLINNGYLEERTRHSNKNGIKKFKALTEKGSKYGENVVPPHNQREVQPLYYEDSFMKLYEIVSQK